MSTLKLYDAQKEGVRRFLDGTAARMVFNYGTGCGKTPTAITAILSHLSQHPRFRVEDTRILVLCPAIVRRHWTREFERWASLPAWPVEMGRHRKSGTKKALAARDNAYQANIQIVSYDLAGEVDGSGWDAIVFDEIHHLSDFTSRQSRVAQRLMRENPGVAALGLSATLIPTDLWQLWHPMWLLFGNEWGRPPRAGKFCWDFVGRYCHVERNEYGSAPGVPRASRQAELKNRLSKVVHRLSREDIADDLPAIDCSVLDVPGESLSRGLLVVGKAPHVRPEVSYAVEWYKSLADDCRKVVILGYHRDLARTIAEALRVSVKAHVDIRTIDGSMPTAERVRVLEDVEHAERAVLVATSESIREGIRLMWADKVLFAEWRQSPAQVVQVLGRFQSVGDRRRPQIQVLTDESLYGASRKLLSRMAAFNRVLKAGSAEKAVEEVFAPGEMTEERLEQLTREMLKQGPRDQDSEWSDEQEEIDEW